MDRSAPLAEERQLYDRVVESIRALRAYGAPTLGTVTGANGFFASTRRRAAEYGIAERQCGRSARPGRSTCAGRSFRARDWETLASAGERVWLLFPRELDESKDEGLLRYLAHGVEQEITEAYKCRIRTPGTARRSCPLPTSSSRTCRIDIRA